MREQLKLYIWQLLLLDRSRFYRNWLGDHVSDGRLLIERLSS